MSQLGLPMSDERSSRRRRRHPEDRRRTHGRIAVLVALVVVAGLVVGGFLGLRTLVENLVPGQAADYPGPGSGKVTVRVEHGDSVRAIGQRLVDADVVASADAFLDVADADPEATQIQPGLYEMQRKMPAADALAVLLDPSSRKVDLVMVPEGRWLSESLAALADGTGRPRAEFDAVAARPVGVGLPTWANGRLDGFVFPESYEFDRDVTAKQAIATTVRRFAASAAKLDLVGGAQRLRRTPYQVVIVASLVEAEAPANARAQVARVIYNRLAHGMPLQLDSTLNFAKHKRSVVSSAADRAIVSPYNTYRVKGLPPTPIDSPGEAALRAALAPAPGDWLYFVTVNPDTGETKFSRDLATHDRHVAELRRWMREHS